MNCCVMVERTAHVLPRVRTACPPQRPGCRAIDPPIVDVKVLSSAEMNACLIQCRIVIGRWRNRRRSLATSSHQPPARNKIRLIVGRGCTARGISVAGQHRGHTSRTNRRGQRDSYPISCEGVEIPPEKRQESKRKNSWQFLARRLVNRLYANLWEIVKTTMQFLACGDNPRTDNPSACRGLQRSQRAKRCIRVAHTLQWRSQLLRPRRTPDRVPQMCRSRLES